MSGGHFDYIQYRIEEVAEEIAAIIDENDNTDRDDFGDDIGHHYPAEVIKHFKEAAHTVKMAGMMIHRIDWLLSGDSGEDSFLSRWADEVCQNPSSKESK